MGIDAFRIEIDVISVIVYLFIWYGNRERAVLEKSARAFQCLVECSVLFSILNSIGLFIPESNFPVIRLINSLKVIACICMGCCWFLSVFYTTSANTYALRKWLIPIIGPGIIVSGITLVETLIHLTEEAAGINPTVWILLNMLSILYIAAASGLCLKKAHKCTSRFHRRCFYIIAIVMLFPLLTLILQAKFYELPITSTVFVLVTLFIHMYRTRQHITVDLTTGLNNANKLSSYLDTITQSQNPAKRLFLVKIEIDHFKVMKKKYGKAASAVVLQKMATFLREQSIQRGTFIAHYEKANFAIIAECNDFSELEAFTNKLITASATNQELLQGPWPITFNIHWSEYGTPDTRTIDKFLDKAESNCIKPATPLPR
jgi:GGDEF domain-containing protein